MSLDWNHEAAEQLDWHWRNQLRPRLQGLTDDEYFWEPVPGCWSIRRRADATTLMFGNRAGNHFGGELLEPHTMTWASTADDALAMLDVQYDRWMAGVRSLGDEGMARPIGAAEGMWAESPYGALVMHLNKEAIHHGAEIALLRDLYARRTT